MYIVLYDHLNKELLGSYTKIRKLLMLQINDPLRAMTVVMFRVGTILKGSAFLLLICTHGLV